MPTILETENIKETNPDPITMTKPAIGRLHVLTDFFFQQRLSHAALAQRVLAGGADTIQFRQKKGGVRHLLHEARPVAQVCHDAQVPLLINDRIDIALAVGAAGVHLGQADFPVADARRLLGEDALVGATATTRQQAEEAAAAGADYIGFGPVFPTASKDNPASVKGLRALMEVCQAVSLPVIAIAGMTPERVPEVLAAGAHGVAVMTAITTAADPTAATRHFRTAIDAFFSQTRLLF